MAHGALRNQDPRRRHLAPALAGLGVQAFRRHRQRLRLRASDFGFARATDFGFARAARSPPTRPVLRQAGANLPLFSCPCCSVICSRISACSAPCKNQPQTLACALVKTTGRRSREGEGSALLGLF